MIEIDNDFEDSLDCILTNEKDYEDFIEDYYDILKKYNFPNLGPKLSYKTKHKNRSKNYLNSWFDVTRTWQEKFYELTDKKIKKNIGKYYIVDRGSKNTFIFFPFPHIQFLLNFRLMISLADQLKDMNFIFVDISDMFFKDYNLKKKNCEKIVINEIEEILNETNFMQTKRFFNVLCFGFLVSRKLIETRKDLYDECILYSPMIHHNITNTQIDPRHLNFKNDFIEIKLFFYLVHTLKNVTANSFYIPKKNQFLNARLYSEFFDDYTAKVTDKRIAKEAHLIMTKNDMIIPAKNILWDHFLKKYEIKNHPTIHGNILTFLDSMKEYLDIIKDIIQKS